jgi:hypothetical protein
MILSLKLTTPFVRTQDLCKLATTLVIAKQPTRQAEENFIECERGKDQNKQSLAFEGTSIFFIDTRDKDAITLSKMKGFG